MQPEERGLFVSLEGVDGAGKTATAPHLADALASRGVMLELLVKQAPQSSHPYGQQQLEKLADLLWKDSRDAPISILGDAHWIHLNAAYFSALDKLTISPALDAGRHVLVDSWYYKFATRAAMNEDPRTKLISDAFEHVRRPDIVVFLDPPIETIAARKPYFTTGETGAEDRADVVAAFVTYQRRVRQHLLQTVHKSSQVQVVRPGKRSALALADHVATLLSPQLGRAARRQSARSRE